MTVVAIFFQTPSYVVHCKSKRPYPFSLYDRVLRAQQAALELSIALQSRQQEFHQFPKMVM